MPPSMTTETTLEQIPEGWDRSAAFYDAYVASFSAKYARDALDLTGVGPGHRVIDVGAGTGALALAAAQRGADVLATDFSRGMVDWMRMKAAQLALTSFEVAEMDGQRLDVPDASFDRAFSVFGLMFFPDRKKGFAELRRVLRPGGVAAVVTWSTPCKNDGALSIYGHALARPARLGTASAPASLAWPLRARRAAPRDEGRWFCARAGPHRLARPCLRRSQYRLRLADRRDPGPQCARVRTVRGR
jgi:ubiquinone/menaquinone biosynthesis C-methylase UbiE